MRVPLCDQLMIVMIRRARLVTVFSVAIVVLFLGAVSCGTTEAPIQEVQSVPAAGATAADPESGSTVTVAPATPQVQIGTQDVWFIRRIDKVDPAGGTVDILRDVLDEAATALAPPISLQFGLTFQEAQSLSGNVVDENGDDLSSITMTYGVISSDGTDANSSAVFLGDLDKVLVAISTPHLNKALVNIDLDDFVSIDLTPIANVRVGDRLRMDLVFAQTLIPMDPAAEEKLTETKIFAGRWNAGDLQILGVGPEGGPLEPALAVGVDVAVVSGSTNGLWLAKAAAVAAATGAGGIGGAIAGAAGGTVVLPIIGTLVGSAAIGVLGLVGGFLTGASGVIIANLPTVDPPDNPPKIEMIATIPPCGFIEIKVIATDDNGISGFGGPFMSWPDGSFPPPNWDRGNKVKGDKEVTQIMTVNNPCDEPEYKVRVSVTVIDTAGQVTSRLETFTVPRGCVCDKKSTRTRTRFWIIGSIGRDTEPLPGGGSSEIILRVKVLDDSGRPVAGANVSGLIKSPSALVTVVQGTTDGSGVAEIRQNVLVSGAYTFTVSDITDDNGDSVHDSDSDIISSIQVEVVIPDAGGASDGDAEALFLIDLGNESYGRGDYPAALLSYESALEIATESGTIAIAYHNMGLANKELGNLDVAVEAFTQAIGIDSEYAFAYFNRATVYESQDDVGAAIEDFTAFLELYTLDDDFSDYARQRIQ